MMPHAFVSYDKSSNSTDPTKQKYYYSSRQPLSFASLVHLSIVYGDAETVEEHSFGDGTEPDPSDEGEKIIILL